MSRLLDDSFDDMADYEFATFEKIRRKKDPLCEKERIRRKPIRLPRPEKEYGPRFTRTSRA